MIAFGAFADLAGVSNDFIDFIGNANLALFVGLLWAYLLARRSIGVERTNTALSEGFRTSGEILLITGVGGSLGEVISASGMGEALGQLFSADAGGPVLLSILLAWFIAAVLHLAIGSVSVAALTASSIIGPLLPQLAVSPVVIGLAIASGALFAVQVNSNFFWMFKALLGLSTTGALKTLTVVTSHRLAGVAPDGDPGKRHPLAPKRSRPCTATIASATSAHSATAIHCCCTWSAPS